MLASLVPGRLIVQAEQELRLMVNGSEALNAGTKLGGEWRSCGPMVAALRWRAGRCPATSEVGDGETLREQPDLIRCQKLGFATKSPEMASPQR